MTAPAQACIALALSVVHDLLLIAFGVSVGCGAAWWIWMPLLFSSLPVSLLSGQWTRKWQNAIGATR